MARSVKHLTEIAALLGERSIDLVVLKQGIAAARTLLGKGEPYAPVGYFWTDQFDVKIQAYGTFRPDARPVVAAGDPAAGWFAVTYDWHGRVAGVLGWNLPRETRQLRARWL
jgi:hypothetical protein